MNLIVKSPVWDDLRRIGLRIAEDDPQAADRFLTAAEEAFELLKQHPHIGPTQLLSAGGAVLAGAGFQELPDFLSANWRRGAGLGGLAWGARFGHRAATAIGVSCSFMKLSDRKLVCVFTALAKRPADGAKQERTHGEFREMRMRVS